MPKILSIILFLLIIALVAMATPAKDYYFTWNPNHPNDDVVEYRF